MKRSILCLSIVAILPFVSALMAQESTIGEGLKPLVAEGASVRKVGTGYTFTEGGARDAKGDVYFTDIPNERIHKWDAETDTISLVKENSGRANGTWMDDDGNLIVCQGGARRVTRIAPDGTETVLAERHDGKRFNSPNDLWMDPKGGIYFTDPRYGGKRDDMEYGGEYVFYLTPDRSKTVVVESDMTRPNGLVGTGDGKTLYIADPGSKETYAYDIRADGTLAGKRLFAAEGSDGMALDDRGNVYLTAGSVKVYAPSGALLGSIAVEKNPSNVCFGGRNAQTLFVTARDSVFTLRMKVSGVGSN